MNEASLIVKRAPSFATLAGIALLLGGCVRYDAPQPMVATAKKVYGVAIYSAAAPYRIMSDSQLRAPTVEPHSRTIATSVHQLHRLSSGTYRNWSWSIWTTPSVAASWQAGFVNPEGRVCNAHIDARCRRLDWNTAFTRLYGAATYLLGKPPLPLELRLNLLPQGQSFQAHEVQQSHHAVPIEFTFWFPTTTTTDLASQGTREHAFLYAVTTVGYEFQHVEYAAGQTDGPASPLGSRLLKDEANSACWRVASQLVILSGRTDIVTIPRVTRQDMTLRAAVFGNIVRVQNAALWGPVLLKHDLGEYLARIVITHAGSSHFRIAATDYPLMNQILAYCRGFTRYGGDIAKEPMPEGAIAHTLFWQSRPKITREPQ